MTNTYDAVFGDVGVLESCQRPGKVRACRNHNTINILMINDNKFKKFLLLHYLTRSTFSVIHSLQPHYLCVCVFWGGYLNLAQQNMPKDCRVRFFCHQVQNDWILWLTKTQHLAVFAWRVSFFFTLECTPECVIYLNNILYSK